MTFFLFLPPPHPLALLLSAFQEISPAVDKVLILPRIMHEESLLISFSSFFRNNKRLHCRGLGAAGDESALLAHINFKGFACIKH